MDWILGVAPWWAWAIVAGALVGLAWRVFGWQGIVGAAVAVLTLGAYRQGWKARDDREVIGRKNEAGDVVVRRYDPDRDSGLPQKDAPPPKKRRTVSDILSGR